VRCKDGLEAWDILDVLNWLVKKSLITVENASGTSVRYHMLETIRQYAKEKLDDAGQGAVTHQRHLAYYVDLAQEAGPRLKTSQIKTALDQLDRELDNLRAAITWALGKEDIQGAEEALTILTALDYFWANHALYWETFPRFQQALERLPEDEHRLAAEKAWGYYVLAALLGDHFLEPEALDYLNHAVRLFRQVRNPQGLALALSLRSYLAFRFNSFFPPDPKI
jgi:hypothetical protein